jgi:hypothetical protein
MHKGKIILTAMAAVVALMGPLGAQSAVAAPPTTPPARPGSAQTSGAASSFSTSASLGRPGKVVRQLPLPANYPTMTP